MESAAAPRRTLLACLTVLVGCAFPEIEPVAFLDAPGGLDGVVSVGPLRLYARTGPEWLDLRMSNVGSTPLVLDWGASAFITPGGHRHALISAARLAGMAGGGQPFGSAGPFDPDAWSASSMAGRSPPFAQPWAHTTPLPLRTSDLGRTMIAPGANHDAVLYPAEHVSLDAFGFFVTELFCDGDDGTGAARPFMLVLRVAVDGQWRDVELTARARTARKDSTG